MLNRNLDFSDPIFALASGTLPSAIAVVRLSGADALNIAKKVFRTRSGNPLLRSRGMNYGFIIDDDGEKIDDVLLLTFVAPFSQTGEDIVEFHCHGTKAVIRKLEQMLVYHGGRPAQRGEFTFRGYLHGKIGMLDIENLGDLYSSRQPADLRRIFARRDNGTAELVSGLRRNLLGLLAVLDTAVDFSDEYANVVDRANQLLDVVTHDCSLIIQRYSEFKSGTTYPRLVLMGCPNAGKSSLFNALLCRYRAIVSDIPGTTRDVIEEDIEIDGHYWKLVDTAGLRQANGEIEQQGMGLARNCLAAASAWILVVDGSGGLSSVDQELLSGCRQCPHLIVWNKADLIEWKPPQVLNEEKIISVSAKTGENLDCLWKNIRTELLNLSEKDLGPLPTASQVASLKWVSGLLDEIYQGLGENIPPEYLSEKVRRVISALDQVVGEVYPDEVLDRIFSEFCIGK